MSHNINLYAAGRRRRATFSRAGLLAIASLAVAAAGVLSAVEARHREQLRAAALDAERAASRIEQRLNAAPKVTQRLHEELNAIETEVVALEAVAARLGTGALGRTTGFTQPLRALARGSTEGLWLTGIHLDNHRAQIPLEGKSLDAARVPALIERLRRAPQFAGTDFATIELKPAEEAGRGAPATLVRFRLATAPAAAEPGAKP